MLHGCFRWRDVIEVGNSVPFICPSLRGLNIHANLYPAVVKTCLKLRGIPSDSQMEMVEW